MRKKIVPQFFATIICTLIIAAIPLVTSAQGLRNAQGNLDFIAGQAGVDQERSIEQIVGGIIQAALALVGVIFLILMVYSGYVWMTARGEEDRVNKAKDTLRAAIIGIIIIVAAYAITTFVVERLAAIG